MSLMFVFCCLYRLALMRCLESLMQSTPLTVHGSSAILASRCGSDFAMWLPLRYADVSSLAVGDATSVVWPSSISGISHLVSRPMRSTSSVLAKSMVLSSTLAVILAVKPVENASRLSGNNYLITIHVCSIAASDVFRTIKYH